MKHVNFYQLPLNTYFIHNDKVYKKIGIDVSLEINSNDKCKVEPNGGCVIDNNTFNILQDKTISEVKNKEKLEELSKIENELTNENIKNVMTVCLNNIPVKKINISETTSDIPKIPGKFIKIEKNVLVGRMYPQEVMDKELGKLETSNEEKTGTYGTIVDQYNKVGGIPIKKKYSEEIKERNSQ